MRDEIGAALRRSGRVVLRELFFETPSQHGLRDSVHALLADVGMEEHWESFYYCVRELVANAQKALIKRLYFQRQGLAIADSDSYQLGMADFQSKLRQHLLEYQQELLQRGEFIELILALADGQLELTLSNRGMLTAQEWQRIERRLQLAKVFQQLSDVQQEIYDEQEGAGYGLFMTALVLHKLGCGNEGFSFSSSEGETRVRVLIPVAHLCRVELDVINAALVQAVQSLPNLPEHIRHLQQLIRDPEASFDKITQLIEQDHSLTAELLRLVNSVTASPYSRVVNVRRAAVLLGMRGIEGLLLGITIGKMLNTRNRKTLWEHSRDCAYLTQLLLSWRGVNRDLISLGYVAGLLHDIGDIILLEVARPVYDLFESLRPRYPNMTYKTFEFIQSGYNHVELGGLIAQKWNFPRVLELSIRYHHDPMAAPTHVRFLAAAVYTADLFLRYRSGEIPEVYLNAAVMKLMGMESEQLFYTGRSVLLAQLDARTDILPRLKS